MLTPFQRVLHAAERTVLDLKPRDRVTPALRELHWLPVAERIQYNLCLLVHKALLGHTPEYISDLLKSAAKIPGRFRLRASCGNLVVPQTRRRIGCCCYTASMAQATDGAETAAIDGLVSSSSENISVRFCLRAPGYGLTLWLPTVF